MEKFLRSALRLVAPVAVVLLAACSSDSEPVAEAPIVEEAGRSDRFVPSGEVGGYGGLVCGVLGAEYPASPAELAERSDLVVVADVAAVHAGRSDVNGEAQNSQPDFLSVIVELGETTILKGERGDGPIFVEVEVCDMVDTGPSGAEDVAAGLPGNRDAIWFLVDATDWQPLPGQIVSWLSPDPAAAGSPVFAPEVAGIIYVGADNEPAILHASSPGDLGEAWNVLTGVPADRLTQAVAEEITP